MHSNKTCRKNRIRENLPFSLALKAELNLVGRESLKFNALSKKLQPQCLYTGSIKENQETYLHSGKSSDMIQGVQEDSWLTATGTGIKMQKEGEIDEKKTERSKTDEAILKLVRKSSWKRIEPTGLMKYYGAESKL